ncbi:hypothetical protein ACWM9A_09615 [Acetobacter pasteurianus]
MNDSRQEAGHTQRASVRLLEKLKEAKKVPCFRFMVSGGFQKGGLKPALLVVLDHGLPLCPR